MASPTVYLIFWLPQGCHYEVASTTSAATCTGAAGSPMCNGSAASSPSDQSYVNLVSRYFHDLAAAPSSYFGILTQYSEPAYPITKTLMAGGCAVDTTAYPNARGTASNPLADTDIRTEVVGAISSQHWTGSADSIFYVFTGLDVQSCLGSEACTPGVTADTAAYCGYHSGYPVGGTSSVVFYANIPDLYSACNDGDPSPNNDPYADVVLSVEAHEPFEGVSDDSNGGWTDGSGYEMSDMCEYLYGSAPMGTSRSAAIFTRYSKS